MDHTMVYTRNTAKYLEYGVHQPIFRGGRGGENPERLERAQGLIEG